MVTTRAAYVAFIGALALERGAELLLSRRNARRAFAQGAMEVGQGHFRVMAWMHSLFLVACPVEVIALARPFPGVWGWCCLVGALLGQALRYWAISTLGERWNVRIIVWPHAGPVVGGPYRFIRHPNYVAVILEVLLVPLIHGAWISAAVFTVANAFLLRVRIAAEERALGPGYAAAFRARPRFVPGLRS
jgi:methyltransferase